MLVSRRWGSVNWENVQRTWVGRFHVFDFSDPEDRSNISPKTLQDMGAQRTVAFCRTRTIKIIYVHTVRLYPVFCLLRRSFLFPLYHDPLHIHLPYSFFLGYHVTQCENPRSPGLALLFKVERWWVSTYMVKKSPSTVSEYYTALPKVVWLCGLRCSDPEFLRIQWSLKLALVTKMGDFP